MFVKVFLFALIATCLAQDPSELLAADEHAGLNYHVYGQASWFMALEICDSNGMRLVRIEDQNKNDEITYFVDKLAGIKGPYWTLGSRLYDDTTWSFAIDDPMKYFNWAAGEPNNSGGNEKCVELYKDGNWNDNECARERFVLCESINK